MIALLFVHLCTLIIWSAALLILPLLIRYSASELAAVSSKTQSIARLWFTRLASPMALLAIGSGTLIFVIAKHHDSWLLVKLTLVTALVVCHVLAGLLILYNQADKTHALGLKCTLLFCAILLLLLGIITIVLFKPSQEQLLWFILA